MIYNEKGVLVPTTKLVNMLESINSVTNLSPSKMSGLDIQSEATRHIVKIFWTVETKVYPELFNQTVRYVP